MSFILIVNAAEEVNESYNQSNENNSFNTITLELKENSANEASNLSNSNNAIDNELEISTNISEQDIIIKNNQNNENSVIFINIYNTTYNTTKDNNNNKTSLNDSLKINNTIDAHEENYVNESLKINNATVTEESQNDISENPNDDSLIANDNIGQIMEPAQNENTGKAVTASFGVYL